MKKHFITGLVIWLPLVLTVIVVGFIVTLLTNPFVGLAEQWLSHFDFTTKGFLFLTGEQVLRYGSQVLILIILFVFTILAGFLGRWLFLHSFINLSNKILHRIPFVNKIYKTSQDVIHTLFEGQTDAFKQVVVVPFPNEKVYSLGLITSNSPKLCSTTIKNELVSVFVPTTPNPTSGFLLMLPKEDIVFIDMRVEDAIKFIISCGVIHPETFEELKVQQPKEEK